ncbi:phage gp6-like head-tail connector protein [Paenibacillus sp. FSL R5-0517]|uniref:phage gp6-like head-tail connector protein n=1 Tax=Paenibacillus sp. FSL R5-0517 TaxID=2921647 RepID=UPI0030DB2D53
MLATVSRLKKMLYIPDADNSQDDELMFALLAASDAIEGHCRRKFAKSTYTERRSGTESKHLSLRNFPIHEITEITGPHGPVVGYTELDDGILFRSEGWPRGEYKILASYVGGYELPSDNPDSNPSTLPNTLEMACLMLAKMMHTGQWGKLSERIDGEYTATFDKAERETDLPPAIQALCDRHVWRLG